MSYSFRRFIEQQFASQLHDAAADYIEYDNIHDISVHIQSVTIEDIDYSPLRAMSDNVTFPVVLKANTISNEDGTNYRHNIMLDGKISGSFSDNFRNIKIRCSGVCRRRSKFPVTHTDDLLPIITKENIEKDAERLLHMVYRHTECPPHKINPLELAHKLGIRVYLVPLSEDCSVRGEYLFHDTHKVLYNEKTGLHSSMFISAGTILIEKKLKPQSDIVRFTIMHELVHAVLHYHAYRLVCMCNPDFTSFFCPVRINEEHCFIDDFVEKMERYADAVASSALMPKRMFHLIVEKIKNSNGVLRDAVIMKSLLEQTASFFGVSISACRKRFLGLGYKEMRGICNYIDGQYVPPFCYAPDSLKKNQTYVVSIELAKKLLAENKKLLKMVIRNLVVFIENHFVLNDPLYVTRDKKLTDYARNHMEQCALKIDLVFPEGCYSNSRFRLVSDGAYRTAVSCKPLTALYGDNNDDFEKMAKELFSRNQEIGEILEELPEGFPKALRRVIEWTDMTQEEFAYHAGMSVKTLSRLISGETQNPTPQMIMRICIGLSLPVELSIRLMKRSGNELRTSRQDLAYMQLLFFSGYYDIEQCNEILSCQGLKTLGCMEKASA